MCLRNQDFSPGGTPSVQPGPWGRLWISPVHPGPWGRLWISPVHPGPWGRLWISPAHPGPWGRLWISPVHPGPWSRLWIILLCLTTCATPAAAWDLHTLEIQKTIHRDPHNGLQFFQSTLYDGEIIFHCKSPSLIDQPRQEWVKGGFSASELEDRNKHCQGQYYEHLQWFDEIHNLLNGTAVVLQRRHGCSINSSDILPFEQWGLNGDDFLTFDLQSKTWVPQSDLAASAALKWNRQLLRNQIRNHVYGHFSQTVCHSSHSLFKRKRQEWGQEVASTDMDILFFAKPIPESSATSLQCHVTASDLSGVRIQLTKDGVPLDSGVKLIGPRPNGDGTNQMRVQAQASVIDTEGYQCEVYRDSRHHTSVTWGVPALYEKIIVSPKPPEQSNRKKVWGVLVCVVAVAAIILNTLLRLSRCSKTKQQCIPTVEEQIKLNLHIVLSNEEYDKWMKIADNFYGKYETVLRNTRL
ncbi:hypothetical protein ACEWY4_022692 [Coilia grayii]|uniref:MHC class I-like antigen recognition-like domain-containing protein n=1 Tax=Coilia grayii TaxID=363190 RepID=A0ABD1J0V9_9TELE